MKSYSLLIITFLLLTFSANSQSEDLPKCRTYDALDMLLLQYPHLRDQMHDSEESLEEHTEQYIQERAGGDDEVYIVPVVFHIIHEGGTENISDEQVEDAMFVLNRDFSLENEDVEDVVDAFSDLPADIDIEFRLARRDPEGNCTNGIIRVESPLTNEGDGDMKDLSRWPRNSYLNVWVCKDAGGAAGYSFLPSSVNGQFGVQNDGIVLLHNYTGSIGTSNVQRSRTLTHEVGHWLNLSHLWGPTNNPGEDDNCDFDDNVSDTPETEGWTSCALSGSTCGSLDNVQNYMEYSYCSRMFTHGQKDRMRAALTSIVAQRSQLWQDENLEETGVLEESILCLADFTTNDNSICAGELVQFEDLSFNDPVNWVWNFGDGTEISGADLSQPTHVFEESGDYTVTLTVSDGTTELTVVKPNFISVLPSDVISNPLEEGFESYSEEITEGDEWYIVENEGTFGWDVYDNAAYTGDQCIRIRNNNNTVINDEDEIISSTFDFSGEQDIIINYKWAFVTKTDETDDKLRVYISNDCGESWLQKKLHRGVTDLPTADPSDFQFVPDDQSEWAENTIVIDDEDFLTSSFRVRFKFENFGGNNIYLDDINIGTSVSLSVTETDPFIYATIYPNPASDIATLEFYNSELKTNSSIVLHSVTGQVIRPLQSGTITAGKQAITLDASDLSAGVYIISISDGERKSYLNWIVQ